ncbi:MAG: hypothetical protein AB1656_08725 [Candidatus Omnitrophota bacterium]
MKKNLYFILILSSFLLCAGLSAMGQVNAPTPTPTAIQFAPAACANAGVAQDSVVVNGDFQADPSIILSWRTAAGAQAPTLISEELDKDVYNYFVMLQPNAGLSQTLSSDSSGASKYRIVLCYMVSGGQLILTLGGRTFAVPELAATTQMSGEYKSMSIALALDVSDKDKNTLTIIYNGSDLAFIDNVQVIPYTGDPEPETTPTPTPQATPVPTAIVTPGPTFTPRPTLRPGYPTPTPTPGWKDNSIQIVANPPLLLVNQDDFVGLSGNQQTKKQIFLDYKVIGANGEPVDIMKIDPEATITFTIDEQGESTGAGVILQFKDNQYNRLTQREKIKDLGGTLIFVPLKPFDGVVRIIVDIEYEGEGNNEKEQQELRGVIPIVMRIDPRASLTGSTGSFNPALNFSLGRQPGDRGFRPDLRTNLYFRERLE